MTSSSKEKILCAAILYHDKDGRPWLVAGHRHSDIIHSQYFLNGRRTGVGDEQGFLADRGNFVNRKVAYQIAWEAGQINSESSKDAELFSEDLY